MTTIPEVTWVPAETFGARLLLVRHRLGLTVDEIAELTGLNRATWSTWERGAHPRDLMGVVAAVVAATNVDRDWLTYGTQGPLAADSTRSINYRSA